MGEWTRIANVQDLEVGSGTVIEVQGKCLALFNVDGSFHVIDNTCLHRGGPLGEGNLEGEAVACPWHGWEYNVKTGHCLNNPSSNVKSYPIKVEQDEVQVEL